ncbi:phosphate acyltransferase [Marinomonas epiphytica]
MIRVALDAMGGDLGPRVAFNGALNALHYCDDLFISIFYTPSESLELPPAHDRLALLPCKDAIGADDEVSLSMFKRRTTSLYQALRHVKEGHSDVMITAGNTGALVALARHILGLIKPKLYPALIRELRTSPLRCLTDLGANVHCPAVMLEGFAQLGAAYVEIMGKQSARVGLLNVGVESSKGSSVIKQANDLLKANVWPEYHGYAEGCELFEGNKNVIVCDGMVGNAVLKASEGLLAFLMGQFKEQGVGFRSLAESFYQTERQHGACLVGVRGNLVKTHGSSDATAIAGAISYGVDLARAKLATALQARLCNEDIK